jgi:S-adenosylmethionine:tRNA ribosyltransferase-isomerase
LPVVESVSVNVSDFDFDLPEDLIAQSPAPERDASRLLVVPRDGPFDHRTFKDLPGLLAPGDLLVLNETAVFPARLLGRRPRTGGKVEILLLSPRPDGSWEALLRSKSVPSPGEPIDLGGDEVTFEESLGEGRARVRFAPGASAFDLAERRGHVPLPPYIRHAEDTSEDRVRYQTVFAREPGAVAAPTAGLHFTPALLAEIERRGVPVAKLVLHVGLGTFQPVRVSRVEDHVMHEERYAIPEATQEALKRARRVVACGTTTVRALESFAETGEARGATRIFIHPPHDFRLVGAMITNFHLPRSTLLMLVAAFAGRERILAAYAEAIARRYRFYSYGDAMFLGSPGPA